VAYVANLTDAYDPELFGVPIDRSREPAKLNPPLGVSPGGVQHDMAFAPDGESVLYRLDAQQIGVWDLYAALLEKVPRPRATPDTTVTRTQ